VTCPKPEELAKNGDVPMSLIGGFGAIGRQNSNLKTDLVFYADAVGTRILARARLRLCAHLRATQTAQRKTP